MKLLNLHLLAYGPFTDQVLNLSPGNQGLHLIFGPNEAGKSSALRALRALLYGVPERTQDDFRHSRTELRVGGRLRGADGEELHCYRRKGRKNTLLDAEGGPIAEERLQRLLGGVDEPLFERLFGIDHQALINGGQALLDERGREAEALFGTGLGSTSVHALLGHFEQEAQSLFAPRASKPALNAGLSRLSELERQQRDLSLAARHWEEAQKAVVEASEQLNALDRELAEATRRRHVLERIRRSLHGLAKRLHCRQQLEQLGTVPALEDDFGERRDTALTRRRVGLEARSKANARLTALRADAAGLAISEELLAESAAIDELRDRLGSYLKANSDRPGLLESRATLIEQGRQRFAEIRAGLGLEDVDALRPMLSRRRRATELGGRREALESAVKQTTASRDAGAVKLAKKREQLADLPATIDPGLLQQAVAEARRAGDIDSAIADAQANSAQHRAACQRELDALGLWQGTLKDLRCAALPSPKTLARHSDAFDALEDEKRHLSEQIAELQKEQRQLEGTLLALRLSGEVPTEHELQRTREQRDLGWQLLKRQWIDRVDISSESLAYAGDTSLPAAFEHGMTSADEVADRLRRESQRVHEHASAQARLQACQQLKADAEAALQRLELERSAVEASWTALWSEIDIAPLPPRDMSAWLETALRLRERLEQGDELQNRVAVLERNREGLRSGLTRALNACNQPRPEGRTDVAADAPTDAGAGAELRPVLQRAESCLGAIERTAQLRSALEEAVSELQDALQESDRASARAHTEFAAWATEWAALMSELGLEDQASPGEVSDYFQSIAAGLQLVDDAKKLEIRIAAIDQEAAEFERTLKTVILRLAPDLAGQPASEAMLKLSSRLTSQREAKSRLDELNKQMRQAEEEIRDADASIGAADEVLTGLCRQAGCDRLDELEAIEQRFLDHRQLTNSLRDVETELIDGGDGLSLEALAAEAQDVDRDAVLAELEALDHRINRELNPKREALLEQKLGAEQAFQTMSGSDEASALAEQAQQTQSELRAQAERYVRLRLAARVLRDEIEAFRRKHRDPILTQASSYFTRLTCASLNGVETDFDDADKPVLVGVRANGERLRVEAMSTGTRDQLYLALRLAALDHYVDSAEPLPLIVDDILIQFDDDRSRATLDALAEFSSKTQVILFTHHERVVAEARGLERAKERVFVHELG